MTALDLQMKNLRDAAINSMTQMAIRMREEATDVKATIGDIEDWLDRIKQLAEEVGTKKTTQADTRSKNIMLCNSKRCQ